MLREVIVCKVCGGTIGPHWQVFQHVTCQKPLVPSEVTPWQVEKSANRLQRMTEKVENGRWLPRLAFHLNGQAKRELAEAHALVVSARELLLGKE